MVEQTVGFTLRARLEGTQAQRQARSLGDEFRKQGRQLEDIRKGSRRVADEQVRGLKGVETQARRTSHTIGDGFKTAGNALDRVNRALDTLKHKFLNLRTAFTTGFLGAVTFGGLRKLLDAGAAGLAAEARVRRQFGAEGKLITGAAGKFALRAGVGDDAATRALIPIMEAVSETQAGDRYRGKRLTAAGAAGVRAQTFGTGKALLERILTLAPDMPPEEVGRLLAEAGSGPEGMRRFAGALNLNRVLSRRLTAANVKGKLAGELTTAEQAKFGVKKGEVAGQGTLLEVLMAKSGLTEEAAGEERKKFGFQVRSIGATLANAIGVVGASAMERLNKGFGEGKTLAERLDNYLRSAKGKETLKEISETVASIVKGFVHLAQSIPQVLGFLERNKGTLLTVAGAFAGLRAYGAVRGIFGAFGGGGGGQGGPSEGGIPGGALPVRMINVGQIGPAIAAAGVGAAIGSWLDAKYSLSDRLAGVTTGPGGDSSDAARRAFYDSQFEPRSREDQRGSLRTFARTMARQVALGNKSPDQAAAEYQNLATRIEGSDATGLSGYAQKLRELVRGGNTPEIKKAFGALTEEEFTGGQRTFGSPVAINIGNLSMAPNMSVPEQVDSIMPEIRRQLVSGLERETANFTAPAYQSGG